MTKIIHFSDWHGNWRNLPVADLYICTGDMLENYPHRNQGSYHRFVDWTIKPEVERRGQAAWMGEQKRLGGLRRFLGNKDAPVVVVRGNHDFVDIGPGFGGEYFEVNHNSTRTVEYCGFKIGGFRGIPPIGGYWSDELTQSERLARVTILPEDLDIVVSHVPPKGILSDKWGCTEFAWLVTRWSYKGTGPKLCCFGHIHEEGGIVENHDGVKYSNASCWQNEIML